jgi:hypothetical protein
VRGSAAKKVVEFAGPGLIDQDLELVQAHLYPLSEVISDHDPVFGRGVRVDEQFWAATTALAAQRGDMYQTPTIIHRGFLPFLP